MLIRLLELLVLSVFFIKFSDASIGDRSVYFQKCLWNCKNNNCSGLLFLAKQPWYMRWMGWDCSEECKHTCMWKSVEDFKKTKNFVPQFYGKWPFVRFAGMQEPASVIFSILNGVSNMIGYSMYIKDGINHPFSKYVNRLFFISVNAWFWSAVFHWRDFPWTEKLDYFSATSLVMYSFYYSFVMLSSELSLSSNVKFFIHISSFYLLFALYSFHVYYLSFIKFDYGYNMIFNVFFGVANVCTNVLLYHYKRIYFPCAWKIMAVSLFTVMFLSLELLDFSPILWIFDSHSLWHLLTIPLPLLFYSYLKDDAIFSAKKTKEF